MRSGSVACDKCDFCVGSGTIPEPWVRSGSVACDKCDGPQRLTLGSVLEADLCHRDRFTFASFNAVEEVVAQPFVFIDPFI